jgi:hypothetical protein
MVCAIFNYIHSQSSPFSQLLGTKDSVVVVSSYLFTMHMGPLFFIMHRASVIAKMNAHGP